MSKTTAGHPAAVSSETASTALVATTAPSTAHTATTMTWLQIGVLGLRNNDKPMCAKDIVAWADAEGLPRPTSGRTPERTLNRDLHAAIRRGDTRLQHGPKRGLFVATQLSRPAAVPAQRTGPTTRPAPAAASGADLPDVHMVLPVAPLAEAIEGRGGLRACGVRYDPGDPEDLVRRVERLARAYLRARDRGYIGIYDADELSVSALGLHPVLLYADRWFNPAVHPAVAAMTARATRAA